MAHWILWSIFDSRLSVGR